jgi:hypothetical protein
MPNEQLGVQTAKALSTTSAAAASRWVLDVSKVHNDADKAQQDEDRKSCTAVSAAN